MRRRAKRRRARATPRVVALLCAALASTPAVARARAMRRDSPRTWDDVARDALETCAPTRDRATCVAAALLANCADGARDAAAATCAARATTTRALDAPSEDARGARRTLLANCAAVGRALGRDRAYDETAADGGARACGTAADATCDGGCVEGVLERVAERAASDDANASAEALVGKVLRTCDAGEGGTYETCARAVGWATARARANERATREVWEACAGAKGANGARACRFGVVEAYVDAGLARGVRDAAEACESSDFVGAGGGEREIEACARALGAALMSKYEHDDAKSREGCDLSANDRVRRACAAAVDEEKTRRDIDVSATLAFCSSALRTPLGQASPAADPSPPPPPPPVDPDQVEHRKEALRRHGTAVGGSLWLACFIILLSSILAVTAYLWWRDGVMFGSGRPVVHYSRVQATELGSL